MVSSWPNGRQGRMDDWERVMERRGTVETSGVANVPKVGRRAGVWEVGIRFSKSR